jgi:hypothetical protein
MADLLALLDQAIDGLTSRGPPDLDDIGTSSVTANPSENKGLTVVPAVPAADRGVSGENGCVGQPAAGDRQQIAHQDPYSKTTGSTGSTGSCGRPGGSAGTRNTNSGGNGGNGHVEIGECGGDALAWRCFERRPLLLRDGRWMHAVAARDIPPSATAQVLNLVERARSRGAVLVADGHELKIFEPGVKLPDAILGALRDEAGAVIAILRGESRARVSGAP